MHGYWWFYSFWWLIFPIMGFVFGGFSMWMGYRAHRDRLELLKTYVAQGKDPDEIGKLMGHVNAASRDPMTGAPLSGGDPWAGDPWRGNPWRYGPWGRYGPYREWRNFIVFTCLAVGFGLASQFADFPGTEHAFILVAIIMAVLAVGALGMAILSTVMSRGMSLNDLTKNGR